MADSQQNKGFCSDHGQVMYALGEHKALLKLILTRVSATSTAPKSTAITIPWGKVLEAMIKIFGPQILPYIMAGLIWAGTIVYAWWKSASRGWFGL